MTVKDTLKDIRASIDAECVSMGEIAYLYGHKRQILEMGDIVLAQWAGIRESTWDRWEQKRSK